MPLRAWDPKLASFLAASTEGNVIFLMTHSAYNIKTHLSFRRTSKSSSENFGSAVALATLRVLNTHLWLVVTIPDHGDLEHFIHCRRFYWTVLK